MWTMDMWDNFHKTGCCTNGTWREAEAIAAIKMKRERERAERQERKRQEEERERFQRFLANH